MYLWILVVLLLTRRKSRNTQMKNYIILEITTTRGLLTTSIPYSSIQNLTLFNLVKDIEKSKEIERVSMGRESLYPFGELMIPSKIWMNWHDDSAAWEFCKYLLAAEISSHISVEWLEEELSYMD